MRRQFFSPYLILNPIILLEKHTEAVCVLYPHELQTTTLALSTACVLPILWARVMSWFRHWKVEELAGKLILELRAKGLQTTPKCPGTKCSGWMEGAARGSPAVNGCCDVTLN